MISFRPLKRERFGRVSACEDPAMSFRKNGESAMPQLIGLALVGVGLMAGYKALRYIIAGSAGTTASAQQDEPSHGEAAIKNLGSLEFDRKSGVYRPRQS